MSSEDARDNQIARCHANFWHIYETHHQRAPRVDALGCEASHIRVLRYLGSGLKVPTLNEGIGVQF